MRELSEFDSTTILLNTAALRELDTSRLDPMQTVPVEPLRNVARGGSTGSGTAYVPPEPLRELSWNARYHIEEALGRGAQGVVYRARREGADGYFTNVALKVYYRHPRRDAVEYTSDMRRIASQGQLVSRIQHDNLINIRDFVAIGETRVMVMEWIDGADLNRLLAGSSLDLLEARLSPDEWTRLNDVVVTRGEHHSRVRPGVAVDILRGCLAGLSALHHLGIAHCDLKPSNVMIKRAGIKKIIDVDSSCVVETETNGFRGTPYYMAPEQLQERKVRLRSDVASLGYVLIEMLTGRSLFRDCSTLRDVLEAKLRLPARLESILPEEVRRNRLLSRLLHKMIAIDPADRFPDADAADFSQVGAAQFHRQLVQANLSTEYTRELSWWVESLLA